MKPEKPDEALFPLIALDPLDAVLLLVGLTVGAAVGGDRIGVPGLTVGICHAVPPGKIMIGIIDVLLVP